MRLIKSSFDQSEYVLFGGSCKLRLVRSLGVSSQDWLNHLRRAVVADHQIGVRERGSDDPLLRQVPQKYKGRETDNPLN